MVKNILSLIIIALSMSVSAADVSSLISDFSKLSLEENAAIAAISPEITNDLAKCYEKDKNPLEKEFRKLFEDNKLEIQRACFEIMNLRKSQRINLASQKTKDLLKTYFPPNRFYPIETILQGRMPFGTTKEDYDLYVETHATEFVLRLLKVKLDRKFPYPA